MTTIPDEGLCGVCEETVRLRRGRTVKHAKPFDPDAPIAFTVVDGQVASVSANCPGSGQHPAVRLEMTFARWLRAHHTRRDARENRVAYLAQHVFRPCTRVKALSEVSWSTAEELRLLFVRQSPRDPWLVELVDEAEAAFEAFVAARAAAQ